MAGEVGMGGMRGVAAMAALPRGYKVFVRATEQEERGAEQVQEEQEQEEQNGESTKLFYEETLADPKLARKNIAKAKVSTDVKYETIEIEDSEEDEEDEDDGVEVVSESSADLALLVAVQQGEVEAARRVRHCDYNCLDR